MSWWMKAGSLLLAAVVLAVPTTALAAEEYPAGRFRVAGEVTAVDEGAGTIAISSRRGEDWRVQTTSDTKYRSPGEEVEGLEDIEPGMKILALGSWRGDEAEAAVVAVADPEDLRDLGRARGEVTTIDLRDQAFSLEARDGDSLRLLVTDDTRFHSRDGEVQGLEDMEVGWHAGVVYRETDRGQVALRIVTGPPRSDRPRLEIRVRGKILALTDESLTLEKRDGDQITFLLTEKTAIRAPDGELAEGMRAGVAGFENEQGETVAAIVIAFRPGRWGEGAEGRPDFAEGSPLPPLGPHP